jgi:hypothetical protein
MLALNMGVCTYSPLEEIVELINLQEDNWKDEAPCCNPEEEMMRYLEEENYIEYEPNNPVEEVEKPIN